MLPLFYATCIHWCWHCQRLQLCAQFSSSNKAASFPDTLNVRYYGREIHSTEEKHELFQFSKKKKKKSTVCVFFFHTIREIIRKKMNTAVVQGPTQTKRGLQATPSLLCLLARCKITHFSIFLVFNNCSVMTEPFCKTLNRKKTPNDHNFEYTLFQFLHLSYFFRRI